MQRTFYKTLCLLILVLIGCSEKKISTTDDVLTIIDQVNNHWQSNNPAEVCSFWDNAAYHTGNMEAYFLTQNPDYLQYSTDWAEHNEWKGAKSDDKENWKYSYGESDE